MVLFPLFIPIKDIVQYKIFNYLFFFFNFFYMHVETGVTAVTERLKK